jgi:hypothetical protein
MMKTFLIATFALALSAPALSNTDAGAVLELNWQDVDKFSDIRAANDSRSRFEERVKRNIETFFQEMASELPEGYTWQATITDVDLAGQVDYFAMGTGQAIRVIKEIHSPAIRFNHLLRDQFGEEVAGGEERLRDMGFMSRLSPRGSTPEFSFERQMLQDWFDKELHPKVSQHAALPAKVSKPER